MVEPSVAVDLDVTVPANPSGNWAVDPPGTITGVLALIEGASALPDATTIELPVAPAVICPPCSVPTTTVPAGATTLPEAEIAGGDGGVMEGSAVDPPPPPPHAISKQEDANATKRRRKMFYTPTPCARCFL